MEALADVIGGIVTVRLRFNRPHQHGQPVMGRRLVGQDVIGIIPFDNAFGKRVPFPGGVIQP